MTRIQTTRKQLSTRPHTIIIATQKKPLSAVVFVMFVLILGLTHGCKSAQLEKDGSLNTLTSSHESSEPFSARFCTETSQKIRPNSEFYERKVWSFFEVQAFTKNMTCELLESDQSPSLAAYPHAYVFMISRRDKARCPNSQFEADPKKKASFEMTSDDETSSWINNYLADLMTRNFVDQTRKCYLSHESKDSSKSHESVDFGFCKTMDIISNSKLDAFSSSMISTATYLSTNITLSLSAILLDDIFWKKIDPQLYSDMDFRISELRKFKPTYDKFNKFLAVNSQSVARDLADGGFLRNSLIQNSASLAKIFSPVPTALFGKIRDRSFELAVEIAQAVSKKSHSKADIVSWHPNLKITDGEQLTVDYDAKTLKFKVNTGPFLTLSQKLAEAEKFAQKAMASKPAQLVWSVSGKKPEQMNDLRCVFND